jgi:hypothetical protein
MAKITFKAGSQSHIIYKLLSNGHSLTHEEAIPHGVSRLAQRIADMKKKFEDEEIANPIMVLQVTSNRTKIARYFFKGYGSPLESHPEAKPY